MPQKYITNGKRLNLNVGEDFDVSGTIQASNIELTENTFYNNLAANSDFVENLYNTIHDEQINIYSKIINGCSTFKNQKGTSFGNCSGCFVSFDSSDLQYGFFMTAAHCVMEVDNETEPPTLTTLTAAYVTNPINNEWTPIDVNNVYYDGTADVALIRTDIDFTDYSDYPLQLSSTTPQTGDVCYIVGNPKKSDDGSLSTGTIRDANYTDPEGAQISPTLYVDAPGHSGSSGSPILNKEGEIIGIFTFGISNFETLGGGSNLWTLNQTLPVLYSKVVDIIDTETNDTNTETNDTNTETNDTILPRSINLRSIDISPINTRKKYLGIDWQVLNPFLMTGYYSTGNFPNQGLQLWYAVNELSPFYNILQQNDLILSVSDGTTEYELGQLSHQTTLGIMNYWYDVDEVTIKYIRGDTTDVVTVTVPFTVTYADIPQYMDQPLYGGSEEKTLQLL